jgi:hypothetical protein
LAKNFFKEVNWYSKTCIQCRNEGGVSFLSLSLKNVKKKTNFRKNFKEKMPFFIEVLPLNSSGYGIACKKFGDPTSRPKSARPNDNSPKLQLGQTTTRPNSNSAKIQLDQNTTRQKYFSLIPIDSTR